MLKTLEHEAGHLRLNAGDIVVKRDGTQIHSHAAYDKATSHGLKQSEVMKMSTPMFRYGVFDKLIFKD